MTSTVLGYRHPATEAVARLDGCLDELAAASLWSMPAADLARLVVAMERVGRRVAAAQLRVLAHADSAQLRALSGAPSTAVWLRNVADVAVWVGKARLRLQRALAGRPLAAAAFAAGEISQDAAGAVCAAVDALPGAVPASQTTQVEQLLVDTARHEGTRAVVRTATEITYRFAPQVLQAQEQQARAGRWLTLTCNHDGTVGLRGLFDKEAGALLTAVLGPLAAPAPATDATPDLRTGGARYADALIHLCEQATPALPAVRGERPNVLVTISVESLEAKAACAPGLLDTGIPISVSATRKLLCDANVIPVVLGTRGEPLDVGRASRTIPSGIRRALIARDQGCAFPGCDRPSSWCDAHHRIHWSDGGETSLGNLTLLCGHHHDTVHHDGWTIRMIDARPWFIPPPWIDPEQQPRHNRRHRLQELGP